MASDIPITNGNLPAVTPVSAISSLSQESELTAGNQDFSGLFDQILTNSTSPASMPFNANMPMLPEALRAQLSTAQDAATATVSDGNALPFAMPLVAWSGTVGVADELGASAIGMSGDGQQLRITAPQNAPDLTTALRAAQQQSQISNPINLATPDQALLQLNTPSLHTMQLDDVALKSILPMSSPDSQVVSPNLMNHVPLPAVTSNAVLPSMTALSSMSNDTATSTLSTPVQHPNWGEQFSSSVKWVVQHQMPQAEIRLNPPELGMLEIRVKMDADQANLTFSSPHAQVREAIESALPRLRDMFGGIGMSLGDVNVSHQSLAQHQSQQGQSGDPSGAMMNDKSAVTGDSEDGVAPMAKQAIQARGMVDIYA